MRAAARACFGAAELEARGALVLEGGCGAAHVEALAAGSVDLLIVDAEGGDGDDDDDDDDGDDDDERRALVAPPAALAADAFWSGAVARALRADAPSVVAVNLIGDADAAARLRRTIAAALPRHALVHCAVPPMESFDDNEEAGEPAGATGGGGGAERAASEGAPAPRQSLLLAVAGAPPAADADGPAAGHARTERGATAVALDLAAGLAALPVAVLDEPEEWLRRCRWLGLGSRELSR